MHNHHVFFWLKSDISQSALLEFEKGLELLTRIPLVHSSFIGKPANTSRPVVDSTYSYGLTLTFADLEQHNLYQVDPIHLEFVSRNAMKWEKVLIYDVEEIALNDE